jgi:hypothetical protein
MRMFNTNVFFKKFEITENKFEEKILNEGRMGIGLLIIAFN